MPKLIEIAALDITIYKFVLPLMDSLKKEGFGISVAVNDSGYTQKIEERGYAVHRIDFVRNLSPLKNLKALMQLKKLFIDEKPDAIHTHTPVASALSRVAARLAVRSANIKVVYTLHGLKKNPVFLFAEYLTCKFLTDFIFTVNKEDMEYLINHKYIKKEKIMDLNGVGIDTEKFNRENVNPEVLRGLREEFKLTDKPVIGFVGRPVDIKGFGELTDAFISIREKIDCRLLIVGAAYLSERDTETLTKAKARLKKSGFINDVVFTGQRNDIPEMLSLMDIFAHPSKWEGMCVSILEAMSMELPVVGTDIRGIREEITEETGFLVPTENAAAISEALEILLKDGHKRAEMGKSGRKRVIEYFSEKEAVRKQAEVFCENIFSTLS